jgi:ResB-like family protein
MLAAIYNRLASLTFGLWLLAGVMLFMAIGSFLQGEGSAINEVALFTWLREVPAAESWWLWLAVGLLALLALNTVLCSWESLRAKWQRGSFLVRIAPQVMHLGFILIVLAHLQSAIGGYKETIQVTEGFSITFPDRSTVQFVALDASYGKMGMPTAMSATVRYQAAGTVQTAAISPNHPLFYQGHGIYLKDVGLVPYRAALVEVHKEPGAGVALAGALLFTVANLVLLAKRRGRERGA